MSKFIVYDHVIFFVLIYFFPLLLGFDYWTFEYCLAVFVSLSALVFSALFFRKISVGGDRLSSPKKISHGFYYLIAVHFFFGLFLYFAADTTGISDRGSLIKETGSYNVGASSFFKVQSDYFLMALGAFLYSLYICGRKSALFPAATISMYLLMVSGTRWYFLLATAPMIVFFVLNVRRYKLSLIYLAAVFISSMLAIMRSGEVELSALDLMVWDIPSFASYRIINHLELLEFEPMSFIAGQVLILIPRFIWPSKPADVAVETFMKAEIGEAYDFGATILPGFLGSAWLYGGLLGAFVFTFFYGFLGFRFAHRASKSNSVFQYAVNSLFFMGLILQLRGMSIGYFVPAIYLSGFFLISSRLRRP